MMTILPSTKAAVPARTQFSQVTPQPEVLENSKKSTVIEDVSLNGAGSVVTLTRKRKKKCGAEKTPPMSDPKAQMLAAISSLPKMELRRRYPAEANAHKNMMSRRGKVGATVHPDFRDFASFLSHVGPIPARRATLDRIDNYDPEYAPGKVRWADKRTQNGNKGDTLVFHYSRTGDTYTTSRLAKLQKVTTNTIRTRHHRGWTDDEIVEGKRANQPAKSPYLPKSEYGYLPVASTPICAESTCAEIQFKRNDEYCRHIRETEGEEYFVHTPDEINEIIPEFCGPAWLEKAWRIFMEETLPKWWKQHKPHIRFHDLKPHQKQLILEIDPSVQHFDTVNF